MFCLCDSLTECPLFLPVCVDPRKPAEGSVGPIGSYGVPVAYERSLRWKVGHFRNLCAVSQMLLIVDYKCSCLRSNH